MNPQFSSPIDSPRGAVPWTQALIPVLTAPEGASTDELAVASQYLLAHVQGDAVTKNVLMRTAGPTELTAGLTVLTCLLIDHLTQFQPGAVLAIATQMRDNSVDLHRQDLGLLH